MFPHCSLTGDKLQSIPTNAPLSLLQHKVQSSLSCLLDFMIGLVTITTSERKYLLKYNSVLCQCQYLCNKELLGFWPGSPFLSEYKSNIKIYQLLFYYNILEPPTSSPSIQILSCQLIYLNK